jgi:uncharacterized protein YdeI (YjbR/CyaY-like superfamily)
MQNHGMRGANGYKRTPKFATGVWLIIFKKESEAPSVYYSEAVEEALCLRRIDSKANKRDEQSYYQFFARRNPKSNWSKINKLRIEKLIKEKRMTEAGLLAIESAKKNGTWTALEKVDNTVIPEGPEQAFNKNQTASENFQAFPKSSQRLILE